MSRSRLPTVRSTKPPESQRNGHIGDYPTLVSESELFSQGYSLVGGVDEVGTGSAAGNVVVGVVVIDAECRAWPEGLRDSKLLSATCRGGLVDPIKAWARDYAVGSASSSEVDHYGLNAALRLAGHRALEKLRARPEVILLDGTRDWLSRPSQEPLVIPKYPLVDVAPVCTYVKADRRCASVAAASILAKVERDLYMIELSEQRPQFGWDVNKGYLTPEHVAAIRTWGLSEHHRTTWKIPSGS